MVWPAGFGYSIYAAWRGRPPIVSTGFLAALTIPFFAVIPAVWVLRPDVFVFLPPRAILLGLAVVLVPIALLIEYGVQGLASFLRHGGFPRKVALHSMWRSRLTPRDHVLVAMVAAGEEIFYRLIWCGILGSLGVSLWLLLASSSAAYGLNHIALGPLQVMSKTIMGILYGSLYLFGGSIWLCITAHVLQNLMLLTVMAKRNG